MRAPERPRRSRSCVRSRARAASSGHRTSWPRAAQAARHRPSRRAGRGTRHWPDPSGEGMAELRVHRFRAARAVGTPAARAASRSDTLSPNITDAPDRCRVVRGREQHAGRRLAAFAGATVLADAPRSDGAGRSTRPRAGRRLPGIRASSSRQRVELASVYSPRPMPDWLLVTTSRNPRSCRRRAAVQHAGNELEVLAPIHVAAVDVDDAVAVKESGASEAARNVHCGCCSSQRT